MGWKKYDWWGYVKGMIRRYPSVENLDVSGNALKEKNAVQEAIRQTSAMNDGSVRLLLVSLVFWKKTHTLSGVSMQIHCSERTARRWHTEFIKMVAKNYGLLD